MQRKGNRTEKNREARNRMVLLIIAAETIGCPDEKKLTWTLLHTSISNDT